MMLYLWRQKEKRDEKQHTGTQFLPDYISQKQPRGNQKRNIWQYVESLFKLSLPSSQLFIHRGSKPPGHLPDSLGQQKLKNKYWRYLWFLLLPWLCLWGLSNSCRVTHGEQRSPRAELQVLWGAQTHPQERAAPPSLHPHHTRAVMAELDQD